MSIERVKEYFREAGLEERIKVLGDSSATVELAAKALGCEPELIAKTMSLTVKGNPILVVTAGDAKIDNRKFRSHFDEKPRMIAYQDVEEMIGHAPGGVCPFCTNKGIPVYLDVSLRRFEYVYPAAGDAHSAVQLTVDELKKYSGAVEWVDVCKGWEEMQVADEK